MPRTYCPPKTRTRAAADPAAFSRAQRRRKRDAARPQRSKSARESRSASRPRPGAGGKAKGSNSRVVPLVEGTRLTAAGRKAASRGEQEYQELARRFEGRVHLSRGRPAAANARLKLSAGPSSGRRPQSRRHRAPPPPAPQDDELTFNSEDSEADTPGPVGQPEVPRMRAGEEGCGRKQTPGRSDPKRQGDSPAGGTVGRGQGGLEEGNTGSSAPRSSHRRAPPPPQDDEFAFDDSDATGEADDHPSPAVVQAKANAQIPRVRAAEEDCGRKDTKREVDPVAGGSVGRVQGPEEGKTPVAPVARPRAPAKECRQKRKSGQSGGGPAKRQQPRKPRPVPTPEPQERKRRGELPSKSRARVPRARLLDLAARYKANHDKAVSRQRQEEADGGDNAVPEGEFEIEQVMASDGDGALLVKWVGYDKPSWEPTAAVPAGAREAYNRQGPVELREYLALLDVATAC